MARAREATVGSGQLTLDDWALVLNEERGSASDRETSRDGAPADHGAVAKAASSRRAAEELLAMPDALLSRTHLRELGLERRAVDAVFRALPVVSLPGYSRPLVRAAEYLRLVDEFTYRDDRVRPIEAHG